MSQDLFCYQQGLTKMTILEIQNFPKKEYIKFGVTAEQQMLKYHFCDVFTELWALGIHLLGQKSVMECRIECATTHNLHFGIFQPSGLSVCFSDVKYIQQMLNDICTGHPCLI